MLLAKEKLFVRIIKIKIKKKLKNLKKLLKIKRLLFLKKKTLIYPLPIPKRF